MKSDKSDIPAKQEILELKEEIEKLRRLITFDLIQIIENRVESKMNDILLRIISTLNLELLREKMPVGCNRYEECIKNFYNFLEEVLKDGMELKEFEALYRDKRLMLAQLENNAPYKRCSTCFSEALELLRKQEEMLLFFKNALKESFQTGIEYENLNVEEIMDKLEPVSNSVRLKILFELSRTPKRFTRLSQATGLDGGNLRFHIRKLMDAGLVAQHRRGGEYTLTERGRIFLERLTNVLYSI